VSLDYEFIKSVFLPQISQLETQGNVNVDVDVLIERVSESDIGLHFDRRRYYCLDRRPSNQFAIVVQDKTRQQKC